MLATQISYWSLQETKRSNRANEKETNRHNLMTEKEINRHNVVTEKETERHNKETERLTDKQITTNYNIALNQLANQRYANETARRQATTQAKSVENQAAYQKELVRIQALTAANNYNLGLDANRIAQQNANVGRSNADTARMNAEIAQNRAQTEAVRAGVQNQADLFNAATKAKEAEISMRNAELREREIESKYSVERQKITQGYVNIITDIFKEGLRMAGSSTHK